jgi:hypothetical protein
VCTPHCRITPCTPGLTATHQGTVQWPCARASAIAFEHAYHRCGPHVAPNSLTMARSSRICISKQSAWIAQLSGFAWPPRPPLPTVGFDCASVHSVGVWSSLWPCPTCDGSRQRGHRRIVPLSAAHDWRVSTRGMMLGVVRDWGFLVIHRWCGCTFAHASCCPLSCDLNSAYVH